MIESKALEINIASYYVDVTVDEKYSILQEVMSKYYGIMEGFNTFLKELSSVSKLAIYRSGSEGLFPRLLSSSQKPPQRT